MLPFPTQFNYADFLVLKDFVHRRSNFPVKSDDSCFPNLSLLINEEILPLLSRPLFREAIRSRQVRGEGTGRLPMPGCWGTGAARKGATATRLAQKGPRGFSAGEHHGEMAINREGVAAHHPLKLDQVHPGQN